MSEFNITTRHLATLYILFPLIVFTVRLFAILFIVPLFQHSLLPMCMMQPYHMHTVLYHLTSDILLDYIFFLLFYFLTPLSLMLAQRIIHTHTRYSCLHNQSTQTQSLSLSVEPIYPRTIVISVCTTDPTSHNSIPG